MILSSTPDNAIQHHNDFGVEVIETDHDVQVLKDGEWWYLDTQTGELLDKVEVN